MKSIIGIVTIGVSPRKDIQDELNAVINKDIDYVHIGALDNINEEELIELSPLNKSDSLVTIYKNDIEVKVSHEKTTKIWSEAHGWL